MKDNYKKEVEKPIEQVPQLPKKKPGRVSMFEIEVREVLQNRPHSQ